MASPETALWQEAMNTEISTLQKMETYDEVLPPPNAHVITSCWVYLRKRNAEGEPTRYKARLVARGFDERKGIDYDETYAPTPRKSTLLTLIALAVHLDWEITHIDVKATYLYRDLDVELYMTAPAGYPTDIKGAVWKLNSHYTDLNRPRSQPLNESEECWNRE
jgi:hypothetical protein